MKILNFLLINLNCGFLFNVFPSIVLLNIQNEYQALILVLLNSFFIILNSQKNKNFDQSHYTIYKHYEFQRILKLFFTLLLLQIVISFFYMEIGNLLFALSLVLTCFTFILFVKSLKIYDNTFLINSYSFFCVFILSSSIIVFLLAASGLYDPFTNLVSYGEYSQFDRNFDINRENIYNPFYLTFIIDSNRGIPLFGDFGVFTGLSHEPHTSMLFVIPGIFLFMRNKTKEIQILFWILSIIFSLISSSVTGLITLFICFLVYLIFSKNKIKLTLKLIIVLAIIYLSYLQIEDIFNDVGLDIINYKLNSESSTGSKAVSVSLLQYLYSPTTVFGSGVLVNIDSIYVKDIGFVNFLIIILMQLFYIIGLIKLFKKSFIKPEYLYYFLFAFYFFIHSFKLGNMAFQNPFYVLIIFILSQTYVHKKI